MSTEAPTPKTTRCTDCGVEFTDEDIFRITACPGCNTKSVPCSIDEDLAININWHELRILTIWAENWAMAGNVPEHSKRTLGSIIDRLEKQRPAQADRGKFAPLTLGAEIAALRKAGYEATLVDESGVEIPPLPKHFKN